MLYCVITCLANLLTFKMIVWVPKACLGMLATSLAVLGMLCIVLGMLSNVLGMLGNVLGRPRHALQRPRRPTSKRNPTTLNDSREPFVLPVIEDSDLDLSDLGLEEVFMTNNEPKEEEEDDVLRPPPPPPIFPPPPFIPEYQTRLAYSPTTDSKHLFTLDNAPSSKWHDEIFSMYS